MRVNVVKPANNSGLPSAKYGYLYVALADDVVTFPEVDESGVSTVGNIVMKQNTNFTLLYLTPSKQKLNTDTTGELESRGLIHKVSGSYPGDDLFVSSFIKDMLNEPMILLSEVCGEKYRKIHGTPWNPMYFTPSFKDDSTDKYWEFNFDQAFPYVDPPLFYNGEVIVNEDAARVYVLGIKPDILIGNSNNQLIKI